MSSSGPAPPGKVLVTGANRGIGFAAAEELARRGGEVLLHARTEARARDALAELSGRVPEARLSFVTCDLARPEERRRMAEAVRHEHADLRVLVHNAGVVCRERTETPEGHETTFAVNHLAVFHLTRLLRNLLEENAPARIVVTASEAHRRASLELDDLQMRRDWHPLRAYGRSKLANVLFTRELARRLEGTGVTANCLHPGVIGTGLAEDFLAAVPLPGLLKRLVHKLCTSPAKGARTTVWLASDPEVADRSGGYFIRCRERRPSKTARDGVLARRLWKASEQLVE